MPAGTLGRERPPVPTPFYPMLVFLCPLEQSPSPSTCGTSPTWSSTMGSKVPFSNLPSFSSLTGCCARVFAFPAPSVQQFSHQELRLEHTMIWLSSAPSLRGFNWHFSCQATLNQILTTAESSTRRSFPSHTHCVNLEKPTAFICLSSFTHNLAENQPSNFYSCTKFENLRSSQKQTIICSSRGNDFQLLL